MDLIITVADGVGYRVRVSAYTFGKLAGKKEVDLFIHTHIREQELSLYGFLTQEELEMFELLISVSGVGPKAALGILSIADPQTVRTAIIGRDTSILTKVSGVGKRIAERVVIELQNKITTVEGGESIKTVTEDSDVIDVLVNMGYSISEARDALRAVGKGISDIGEKIRRALKHLGK